MMSPNRRTFFQCTSLAIGLAVLGACLFPGTAPAQSPEAEEEYVTMDFQDVDLVVLVKFISELTGKNFIIDEKVRGKVTVISPTKITKDEAYQVFESVLDIKGFTTVPAGKVIGRPATRLSVDCRGVVVSAWRPGHSAGTVPVAGLTMPRLIRFPLR